MADCKLIRGSESFHGKQGLDYFHAEFQVRYPWGKYDQAFVPEVC